MPLDDTEKHHMQGSNLRGMLMKTRWFQFSTKVEKYDGCKKVKNFRLITGIGPTRGCKQNMHYSSIITCQYTGLLQLHAMSAQGSEYLEIRGGCRKFMKLPSS